MISQYVEELRVRQELEDAKRALESAALRFARARAELDRYLTIPVVTEVPKA